MKQTRTHWIRLRDFLTLVIQQRRSLLPVILLGAVTAALSGAASLFCYARIIDLVLAGDYRAALTWVAVMLGTTLALTLTSNACTHRIETSSRGCRFDIQKQMMLKNASIPYEDLESTGILEEQRNLDNQERTFGHIYVQISSLYTMLQQLLSAGVSLAFIAVLLFQASPGGSFWGGPWPVVLAVALAAGLFWTGSVVNRQYEKIDQRATEEILHSNAVW